MSTKTAEQWYLEGVQKGFNSKPALEYYEKALKIDPRHQGAWYMKGTVLSGLGKNKDAMNCCDKVISLNHNYWQAYHLKAQILTRMGKPKEAEIWYKRSASIPGAIPPPQSAKNQEAKKPKTGKHKKDGDDDDTNDGPTGSACCNMF